MDELDVLIEMVLSEDWEALKKDLTKKYINNEIDEAGIRRALKKAGMGTIANNIAYRIAENNREERAYKATIEQAKNRAPAAKISTENKSRDYMNTWQKKMEKPTNLVRNLNRVTPKGLPRFVAEEVENFFNY